MLIEISESIANCRFLELFPNDLTRQIGNWQFVRRAYSLSMWYFIRHGLRSTALTGGHDKLKFVGQIKQ